MFKRLNSVLLSIFSVVIMLGSFSVPAAAAAKASLSLNPKKNSYSVGETFSITVGCSATGDTFFGIKASLTFDESVVKCTNAAGGTSFAGKINFVDPLSGETSINHTKTLTFQTLKEGSCYFNYSAIPASTKEKYSSSAGWTIKVANPAPDPTPTPTPVTPSSNANLASLKVSGATLSPRFASNKTDYSASVPYTTSKVTITAGVADAGATVVGAGTIDLKVGENKRTLTVTAASGAKKSYNITITRLAEDAAAPVTPPSEPKDDPLSVSAEGTTKKIMQDITSMTVPAGFSQTTVKFDDIDVGALTEAGGKYTLFYISNDDGTDPDLYYKNSNGEYIRLCYLTVNNKFYIIEEPGNGYPPSGWRSGALKLPNGSAFAFVSEDERLSDFYVIYCYTDGGSQFYRYDSLQGSIQRSPDFALTSEVDKKLTADSGNLFTKLKNKFKNMSPIGAAVIALAVLLTAGITVLAIFVVKRTVENNKRADQHSGIAPNNAFSAQLNGYSSGDDHIHTQMDIDMDLLDPEINEVSDDKEEALFENGDDN